MLITSQQKPNATKLLATLSSNINQMKTSDTIITKITS